LIVLVAILGTAASCRRNEDEQTLAYSQLKRRIAEGQVAEVRFSAGRIQAVPTEEARQAGAPALWIAVPVATDASLLPLLDERGVTYDGAAPPSRTIPMTALLPLVLAGVIGVALAVRWHRLDPARGTSGRFRPQGRGGRAQAVTRFSDVAGVEEAQEELEEIVGFLQNPGRFARLGARAPKGILMVGPPGTGKTLLAKAVAGEAGVPFFAVSGSEFQEVFVGVGASRVRRLFQQAKKQAPAIIFIDELDAIGKSRTGAPNGANDEREHTLNQLLVEMDGFNARDGLIVIGATNRAETLDAALLRPGRFDRQVLVDRPDRHGREAILRVHARRVVLAPAVDLGIIARRTSGFVGADLENLLNEAALLAARHDRSDVGMDDLERAIDRVVAGLERKQSRTSDRERRVVAYHEAGHAIVAELSPHAEEVLKVSIKPRGRAALGYMQQVSEDRHLLQHAELMERLAVLLGGRAAEQIAFGQLSTGASNDLERATTLARRMVCEFGMSAEIGPVAFLQNDRRDEASTWSERATSRIEAEVQQLLATASDRAMVLLLERRAALDAVAEALLSGAGEMDRSELQRLLDAAAA
jgi:cell division protease FtsH